MTKKDLAKRIVAKTGIYEEDVLTTIQLMLDYITDALAEGDRIEFRNFGVFEVCTRKPRIGRNPNRPGDIVRIPERKTVKFKPGKIMKHRIAGTT